MERLKDILAKSGRRAHGPGTPRMLDGYRLAAQKLTRRLRCWYPRFEPLKDRWACVPTLYKRRRDRGRDHRDDVVYRDSCLLVLVVLMEKNWNGRWSMSTDEKIQLWQRLDYHKDGSVDISEILEFADRHKEELQYMPSALQGIFNEDVLRDALETFDDDHNDVLDSREWVDFLFQLEILRARFLLYQALSQFQAYFGRGRHFSGVKISTKTCMADMAGETLICRKPLKSNGYKPQHYKRRRWGIFQCGRDKDAKRLLPPGLWADMVYYSANNHPLHGIFCCDQSHPLDSKERLFIELVTIGLTLIFEITWTESISVARVGEDAESEWVRRQLWAVLLLTIPSVIGWWLLFLLFVMPGCGTVDDSKDSERKKKKATIYTWGGRLVACFVGLTVFIIEIVIFIKMPSWEELITLLLAVFLGMVSRYLFAWGMMAFFWFNPFVAWGDSSPEWKGKPGRSKAANCCAKLGNIIGLGQWRIEKQRFQGRLVQHLKRSRGQNNSIRSPARLQDLLTRDDSASSGSDSSLSDEEFSTPDGGWIDFVYSCFLRPRPGPPPFYGPPGPPAYAPGPPPSALTRLT